MVIPQTNQFSVFRALQALMDAVRSRKSLDNGWMFALTWLAAARLTLNAATIPPLRLEALLTREHWSRLVHEGLPEKAVDIAWLDHEKSSGVDRSLMSHALAIISSLTLQDGEPWDVLDASRSLMSRERDPSEFLLSPDLADLLVAAINISSDTRLWIPFDPTGQLSIRAMRAGATVLALGPDIYGSLPKLQLKLLLILEGRPELHSRLYADFDRVAHDVVAFDPTDVLVSPPWGMRVPQTDAWRSMAGLLQRGALGAMDYRPTAVSPDKSPDRVESWVLSAFWSPSLRRGVFLVPPMVMFAKGKERRLRESLVWHPHGNQIRAVLGLPVRTLSNVNIAHALVVLDGREGSSRIRMVDASQPLQNNKALDKREKRLDVPQCMHLLFGPVAEPPLSIDVSVEELDSLDFNLQPSRYLKRITQLEGPRVALEELVKVVRAPTPSKEVLATRVWEIGIAQLDCWQPIAGPFDKEAMKHTAINPRKADDVELLEGDVVVSIKGTIGKAGLVGPVHQPRGAWRPAMAQADDADDGSLWPTVAAQSCIALRIKPGAVITPELLLLYLRSADCQRQFEALRKGSTVAHITPAALLQEIQVPVISAEQIDALAQKYRQMTSLEQIVHQAQQDMQKIQDSLWPVAGEGSE